MTTLQPINDIHTLNILQHEAAADNHAVFAPTHVIKTGDKITGYVSMGGIPLVHGWFDTRDQNALRTKRVLNEIDRKMLSHGHKWYQTVLEDTSPFVSVADRLGFKRVLRGTLFMKGTRL